MKKWEAKSKEDKILTKIEIELNEILIESYERKDPEDMEYPYDNETHLEKYQI